MEQHYQHKGILHECTSLWCDIQFPPLTTEHIYQFGWEHKLQGCETSNEKFKAFIH
jgi:hypothetical protein